MIGLSPRAGTAGWCGLLKLCWQGWALSLALVFGGIGPASAAAPVAEDYQPQLDQIMDAALASDQAYKRLGELCDSIGPRLAGSPEMAAAVAWVVAQMRADGLDSVWTEPVMVPRWVRGEEWGKVTSPVEFPLTLLGLGRSVGTPPAGTSTRLKRHSRVGVRQPLPAQW